MKTTPVATIRPMRFLIATIGLALAARTAHAECTVDVARAPDDVRTTIQRWVAAESHCAHALEVRIVPTEGGLYLYARDEHGVVRERVVPDGQAAGVLVASWVADDSPAVPVRVMPIIVAPKQEAPAAVNGTIEAPAGAPISSADHHSGVLFGLGAGASIAHGYALRGELALESGGWQVYAAASVGQTRMYYDYGGGGLDLMPIDKRLALGVGRMVDIGSSRTWQLRARAGLQYAKWSADFASMSQTVNGNFDVTFAGIESSLLLSRKLTPAWSFTSGVAFSKFMDHDQSAGDGIQLVQAPAFDLGLTAGLDVRM
jgi:hypothetical protein